MKKIFLLNLMYMHFFYSAHEKNSINKCLLLKVLSLRLPASSFCNSIAFNFSSSKASNDPFCVLVDQYCIEQTNYGFKYGLLLNFNFKFHTEYSIIKFLYENNIKILHYCKENNISLQHICLCNSFIYSDQCKDDGQCTFQKNIEELIKKDNAFFKYKINEIKGVKKINIIGINSKFVKPIFFLPIYSPAWYAFDRFLKELCSSNNVVRMGAVCEYFEKLKRALLLKSKRALLLLYIKIIIKKWCTKVIGKMSNPLQLVNSCCLKHSKKTMLMYNNIIQGVFSLIIYGPVVKARELFIKYELCYNNYFGNINGPLMHEIWQNNRYRDVILLHYDGCSYEQDKLLSIRAYVENANDFIRLMMPVNNVYSFDKFKEYFYTFSIFEENTILDISDEKNISKLKKIGECSSIKIINTNVAISHEKFKEMFKQFYLRKILNDDHFKNYFICEGRFIGMFRKYKEQLESFNNNDLLLKAIQLPFNQVFKDFLLETIRLFFYQVFNDGLLPKMSNDKCFKEYINNFFDTLYEWNDKNYGAVAIKKEEFFTIICKKLFFRLYAINNMFDYEEEAGASSIILRGEMVKWFITACEKNCKLIEDRGLAMSS